MKLALNRCAVWFATLDRMRVGFLFGKRKERNQPVTPRRAIFGKPTNTRS